MPVDVSALRARFPERQIEWFGSVTSTMTIAARLARDGCPHGTIVGANGQIAGVGRHGRTWHSETEAGLYVSIVLRLPLTAMPPSVIMLALGLAAQQAITEVTGLAPDLRWPNDVLLHVDGEDRKCAGILAQLELDAIVAGIGINVNQTEFPNDLDAVATSLALAGKRGVPINDVLEALIREIDQCCEILRNEGAASILRMFTLASSYAEGRRVRVENGGAIIEGVTCGLNSSGFLRVREDNGKETTILAGGVRPA